MAPDHVAARCRPAGDNARAGREFTERAPTMAGEPAGRPRELKGPVALRPSPAAATISATVASVLGGGERSIVLKFTGAAIDFDRIESRHAAARRQEN